MASREQRHRRHRILIAHLGALFAFTGWLFLSSLAGEWTAEQPVTNYAQR